MRTKSHWDETTLQEAVAASVTISGVLRRLDLSTSPGNYRTFHTHVRRLNLDTTHFLGQHHGKGRPNRYAQTWNITEILVRNSPFRGSSKKLKSRLLHEGLLSPVCTRCTIGPWWNEQALTLELDHINGDPFDHRLENLRILCPNCHSQTRTFRGKRIRGRYARNKSRCVDCGTRVWRNGRRCRRCAGYFAVPPKIKWPTLPALFDLVETHGYRQAGQILGVSDNAIRKHIRARTTQSTPMPKRRPVKKRQHGGP